MTGIEDRVRLFLDVWKNRKAGALPSSDLAVPCSVCGAVITGDKETELVNMEIVCWGCRESTQGDPDRTPTR